MREQLLISVLSDLNATSSDITASAVISSDGLPIATLIPQGLDADRVGAMSATLLALGSHAAAELHCGDLDQVMVKGKNGYILLNQAGADAVLALIANESGKLGLILLDAKRAAKHIADII
ncbi:roadblock/LC7 domain-containing protein [Kingella potus]|uniref:roadblock/LC7 domain-containing protein n=1 Tax=Kingella potus TaxID=265175 RepID=UPI000E1BC5CB|nr:roadblock/LC7 domain-containing protein [Kingella potus]UOP01007.1 roadblock/LC7 domain-containing protein [Kingella potus]